MQTECNSDTDQSKQSLSPKFNFQRGDPSEVSLDEEGTPPRGQRAVKSQRKNRPNSAPRCMSDTSSWRGCNLTTYCLPDIRRTPAMYIEQDIIHKQRQEIQLLMEELGNRDQELNDLVMSHQKQVKAWESDNEKQKALQARLSVYEDELKVKEEQLKKTLVEMAHVKEQREVDALDLKKTQNEMIKLTERIMENSVYVKEMETQNQKLNTSLREFMTAREEFTAREQEFLSLLKEKDFQLIDKQQEVDKLVEHMKFLDCQCRELGERNNNMTEESVNWKKKYYLMKEEVERLHGDCRKKEESIQKMTQQLHESLQQAIALQKALFTSCEREKCKEEVMYSLRKQHKRTMQELQNIRELYDRLSGDTSTYHLNSRDKDSDGKKKEEQEDEERRKMKDGKVEDIDKWHLEGSRKVNIALRPRGNIIDYVSSTYQADASNNQIPAMGCGNSSKNADIRGLRGQSSSQVVANSEKSSQSQASYQNTPNGSDVCFKPAGGKQLKDEDKAGDVTSDACCSMSQSLYEDAQSDEKCRKLKKDNSQADASHADRSDSLNEGHGTNSESKTSWTAPGNVESPRGNSCLGIGKEGKQALASAHDEILRNPKQSAQKRTGKFNSQEALKKSFSMETQTGYMGADIDFHNSASSDRNYCPSARVSFHPQNACLQTRPRSEGSVTSEEEERRTHSLIENSHGRGQYEPTYFELRQEQNSVKNECQNSNIGEDQINLNIQSQQECELHLSYGSCDQCRLGGKVCCDCSRIQKSYVPNSNRTTGVLDPALSKSNNCHPFQKDLSGKSPKVSFKETSSHLEDDSCLKNSHLQGVGRSQQVVGSQRMYGPMVEFNSPAVHHSNMRSHFPGPTLDSFHTPICVLPQPLKPDLPDEVSAYLARQRSVRREVYFNNNNRSDSPLMDLQPDMNSMIVSSEKKHENVIDGYSEQSQNHEIAIDGYSEQSQKHEITIGSYSRQSQNHEIAIDGYSEQSQNHEIAIDGYSGRSQNHEIAIDDYSEQFQKHEIAIGGYSGRSQCETCGDFSCSNGVCNKRLVQFCVPIMKDSKLIHDSEKIKGVLHKQENLQDERREKKDEMLKRFHDSGNNDLNGPELSNVKNTDNCIVDTTIQLCEPVKELSSLEKTVSGRRFQLVRRHLLDGQMPHKIQSAIKGSAEESCFYPEETDSEGELTNHSTTRMLSGKGKEGPGASFQASIPMSTRSRFSRARTSSLQKHPSEGHFSEKTQPVQADLVPKSRDSARSGITVSSGQERPSSVVSSSQNISSFTVPSYQERSNNTMLPNQERQSCRFSEVIYKANTRNRDNRNEHSNNTSDNYKSKLNIQRGRCKTSPTSADHCKRYEALVDNIRQKSGNSSSNVTFDMSGNSCRISEKIKLQTGPVSDVSRDVGTDNINNNSDARHLDNGNCSNIQTLATSAASDVSPQTLDFVTTRLAAHDTVTEESRAKSWCHEVFEVDMICFVGVGVHSTASEAKASRETTRFQNVKTYGGKIRQNVSSKRCLVEEGSHGIPEQISTASYILRSSNVWSASFILDVGLKGDLAIEKMNQSVQTRILCECFKNFFHVYPRFEEKLEESLEEENAGCMSRLDSTSHHHHPSFSFLEENRNATVAHHQFLYQAICFFSIFEVPVALASSCIVLLHVFFGFPTFFFPWGFHSGACLVIPVVYFIMVCPIHLHFMSLISISIGFCLALFHKMYVCFTAGHLM